MSISRESRVTIMCTVDDWTTVFCPEGKASLMTVSILVSLILCVSVCHKCELYRSHENWIELVPCNFWGSVDKHWWFLNLNWSSDFVQDADILFHVFPGRGLVVNFRKKCGEMWWKKIIFTAFFVHLFAVNAVNRGELFFFTAFSVAVNFFHRLMRWIIFFQRI